MAKYTVRIEATRVWNVEVEAVNATMAEATVADIPESQLGEPDSEFWEYETTV